jgi:hypothetical protein
MTSLKQIEANRRNALKSTGPATEAGKKLSRRNAVRHGLTAETILELVEDPEEYRAFELSITSDFDARTGVERELVLRLASVLWRLRRATAIESGLLHISAAGNDRPVKHDKGPITDVVLSIVAVLDGRSDQPAEDVNSQTGEMALRFLRLAKFDSFAFERLNRYETALVCRAPPAMSEARMLSRSQQKGG